MASGGICWTEIPGVGLLDVRPWGGASRRRQRQPANGASTVGDGEAITLGGRQLALDPNGTR